MEGSICGEVIGRQENKMRNVLTKILSIFRSPGTLIWKFIAPPLWLLATVLRQTEGVNLWVQEEYGF
jgi:hypothetical protein